MAPEKRGLAHQEHEIAEFGDSRNWRSAQHVIEEVEREMKRIRNGMELFSLINIRGVSASDFKLDVSSVVTLQFSNIDPTEIDECSVSSNNNTGPAVLTARIYIPQSFTYTAESMTRVRREYVVTKGLFSIIFWAPASTTAAHLKDLQSTNLEFQRLNI